MMALINQLSFSECISKPHENTEIFASTFSSFLLFFIRSIIGRIPLIELRGYISMLIAIVPKLTDF